LKQFNTDILLVNPSLQQYLEELLEQVLTYFIENEKMQLFVTDYISHLKNGSIDNVTDYELMMLKVLLKLTTEFLDQKRNNKDIDNVNMSQIFEFIDD